MGLHKKNSTYMKVYEHFEKQNGPLFLQRNVSDKLLTEKYYFQPAHLEELHEHLDNIRIIWNKIKNVTSESKHW